MRRQVQNDAALHIAPTIRLRHHIGIDISAAFAAPIVNLDYILLGFRIGLFGLTEKPEHDIYLRLANRKPASSMPQLSPGAFVNLDPDIGFIFPPDGANSAKGFQDRFHLDHVARQQAISGHKTHSHARL